MSIGSEPLNRHIINCVNCPYSTTEERNYTVTSEHHNYVEDSYCDGTFWYYRTYCTRCGDTVEVDRLAPLFINKGYSYFGTSILQEFAVNRDLIDEYKAYLGDIKFGVVAATVQSDGLIMNVDGTAINEKVKYVEYTEKEFDIFAMKVNGIGEGAYADTPIYVCAYLICNGEVKYLSNGKALTSADSICYNDLIPVE